VFAVEPVSLVLAALATGAAAGVTDGVTDAVKNAVVDAYGALKALLKRAFGEDEVANAAMIMYERKPDEKANVDALAERLTPQVVNDPDIKAAAERVLQVAGPAATGEGSVAAAVLQIHAETGGVAAGSMNAPVTLHNVFGRSVPGEGDEASDRTPR
jgi:hypothetical protein